MKVPTRMPPAKKRLHTSFFQLYLKKEISAGKQAAQICRKLDERPKTLFPNNKSKGTISPINGPLTHQGQGCFKISIILVQFSRYNFSTGGFRLYARIYVLSN